MKKAELKSIIREEVKSLLNEGPGMWEITFHQDYKGWGVNIKNGQKESVKGRNGAFALKKWFNDERVRNGHKKVGPHFGLASFVCSVVRK